MPSPVIDLITISLVAIHAADYFVDFQFPRSNFWIFLLRYLENYSVFRNILYI